VWEIEKYAAFKLGASWGLVFNATPRQIYYREWPDTHCVGSWVDSRDFLDGSGNITPRYGFDHRTVHPKATLSRPTNNSSIAEAFHSANFRCSNYIAYLRQKCHNSKFVIFSGEPFKGFEVLHFSMSATTTQLLSSGEFCKLRYDTIPVKSASANHSFYTSNSKMPNFEL
jgi:hypothetical protein